MRFPRWVRSLRRRWCRLLILRLLPTQLNLYCAEILNIQLRFRLFRLRHLKERLKNKYENFKINNLEEN